LGGKQAAACCVKPTLKDGRGFMLATEQLFIRHFQPNDLDDFAARCADRAVLCVIQMLGFRYDWQEIDEDDTLKQKS
jgi:hypothetical protein